MSEERKLYRKFITESTNEARKSEVLSDEDYANFIKSYMSNDPDFEALSNMLPMINDDLKDQGIKTIKEYQLKRFYKMLQAEKPSDENSSNEEATPAESENNSDLRAKIAAKREEAITTLGYMSANNQNEKFVRGMIRAYETVMDLIDAEPESNFSYGEKSANEAEDFYHYSWANKLTDPDKIKNLIKDIKDDIKKAKEDKNKELIQELKQDLQKARALLSDAKASKSEGTAFRGGIEFSTLGGDVQIYVDAYDSVVGFNSGSRGDINFYGPELNANNDNYRKIENELRQKIYPFIEQAVAEYDSKVDAFMKELGFERK